MNNLQKSDDSPPRQPRSKLAPGAQSQGPKTPPHLNDPDWWRLRAAIMLALHDFPEARQSVIDALQSLDPRDPNVTA